MGRLGMGHRSCLPLMVTAHGLAAGFAPRDFAGSEERGRGGREALFELAKRASSPPCRDGATSDLPAHEREAHPVAGP